MTKPLKAFEKLTTDEKRRLTLSSIAKANPNRPVGPHINGRVPDENTTNNHVDLPQKFAIFCGLVAKKFATNTLLVHLAATLCLNARWMAITISALIGLTVTIIWSPEILNKIALTSVFGIIAVLPFLEKRFVSWMAGSIYAAILATWVSFLLSDCPGNFGNGFGWPTLIILVELSTGVGFVFGFLTWLIARTLSAVLKTSNLSSPPFQYSLWQGMIQIAVIAVLLAITSTRVGHRYARSVPQLEAAGFTVLFDCWGNPKKVWARIPTVSDADLSLLANAPTIQFLGLVASSVTDNGISQLSRLPNLRSVLLPTQITDVGIASLVNAQSLRYVDATGCQVTTTGYCNLQKLPYLQTIRTHPNMIRELKRVLGFDGIELTTKRR